MDWIKCSEQLPESGKRVLMCFAGSVFEGWHNGKEWVKHSNISGTLGCFDDCKVTHWMELPEAPNRKNMIVKKVSRETPKSLLLNCRSKLEVDEIRENVSKYITDPYILSYFFQLSCDCLRYIKVLEKTGINANNIEDITNWINANIDGRLIILNSKPLPLIWGDKYEQTILCPNCKRDLMGGYTDKSLGYVGFTMYQCPYCGQPINTYETVPYNEA